MDNGDTYKRRRVGVDEMQCGCRWTRRPVFGDVLEECIFHKQISNLRYKYFERKRISGRGVEHGQDKSV